MSDKDVDREKMGRRGRDDSVYERGEREGEVKGSR